MPLMDEQFEPDARSVGSARRSARAALQEHGLGALQDDVSTVVSELATNAVLHARSGFTVILILERDRLVVSVVDDSSVLPRLRRTGGSGSTTGRGLQMVEALSTGWGVVRSTSSGGKVTWCEFELTRPLADGDDSFAERDGVPVVGAGEVDVEALLAGFDDEPDLPGAGGRQDRPVPAGGERAAVPS